LKTLGIPGELLKIAPVAAVDFADAGATAACLRFMFISSVPVVQLELAFNGAYLTSVKKR
jgi:hypothetical protein